MRSFTKNWQKKLQLLNQIASEELAKLETKTDRFYTNNRRICRKIKPNENNQTLPNLL